MGFQGDIGATGRPPPNHFLEVGNGLDPATPGTTPAAFAVLRWHGMPFQSTSAKLKLVTTAAAALR